MSPHYPIFQGFPRPEARFTSSPHEKDWSGKMIVLYQPEMLLVWASSNPKRYLFV